LKRALSLLPFAILFAANAAQAHSIDTVSLTLVEVSDGSFMVDWQVGSPTLAERLAEPAIFPRPCHLSGRRLDCGASGLVGAIEFPWLEGSATRVLVRIDWRTGSRLLRVIDGRAPSLTVYGSPSATSLRTLQPIAVDYTRLGIEHILTGYDHLLFVLALTLLVRRGRRLLAAVTAFTVAHSLTLACTVLGVVTLPSPPVEASIALSIVLVCIECLRPSESLAHRAPWLVTFAFGLLHGFGFASALLAIGLPERHVPAALLFFNVGVEVGQLATIALVILVRLLARRWAAQRPWLSRGVIYTMGGTAAFWSIERAIAIFAR
jgi:hydrogenase/urease accessory protein HupE